MACYHPIKAYRARRLNPSGKRGIVFNIKDGYEDMPVELPCGQCMGCRLEHSRQWAIRMMHEASQYENNCFITLTYDNEHLPPDGSLQLSHFQDFFKRFRKKFVPKCPYKKGDSRRKPWLEEHQIRFYHCGEYGSKFGRPHYHIAIFNFDFSDKKFYKTLPSGFPCYISESLASLWTFGIHQIGAMSFESAAYIARYITKKITGTKPFVRKNPETGKIEEYENAEEFYQVINYETGEVTYRRPEYSTMSRRPGIGKRWFDKYKGDIYPHDFIVVRGKKMKVPKYYDGCYELENPEEFSKLKYRRKQAAILSPITSDRLEVMEKVRQSKTKLLIRPYETGLLSSGH